MVEREPATCSRCGGESYRLVTTFRRFGVKDGSHGGKQSAGKVTVGGDLCDRCTAEDEAAAVQAERAERHARNREGGGLPGELTGITFDGFTQPEAVDLARRWARGEVRGLLLTGDTGVGKTWLGAAAMWEMLYRRRVRWVETAQLVAALRAGYTDEARAAASRIVTGNGPAVFDELDKVTPSDFVREVLFAAINARYNAGAPLLFTTNLPIERLGRKLGKPILSRLDGYCEIVEMVGPDRRVGDGG